MQSPYQSPSAPDEPPSSEPANQLPTPTLMRWLVNAPNGPRLFAEVGCELPDLAKAKQIVGQFASITGDDGGRAAWKLSFAYRANHFTIDYPCQCGSAYLVDDPSCPDEILREVAQLLDRPWAKGASHRQTVNTWRRDFLLALAIGVLLAIAFVIAIAVFGSAR